MEPSAAWVAGMKQKLLNPMYPTTMCGGQNNTLAAGTQQSQYTHGGNQMILQGQGGPPQQGYQNVKSYNQAPPMGGQQSHYAGCGNQMMQGQEGAPQQWNQNMQSDNHGNEEPMAGGQRFQYTHGPNLMMQQGQGGYPQQGHQK